MVVAHLQTNPYRHPVMKYSKWLLFATLGSMLLLAIYPVTSQARAFVKFGKDKRMELGGWIHGGATFNPSQTNGFNGPVVFADQANRFQLNQFYLK